MIRQRSKIASTCRQVLPASPAARCATPSSTAAGTSAGLRVTQLQLDRRAADDSMGPSPSVSPPRRSIRGRSGSPARPSRPAPGDRRAQRSVPGAGCHDFEVVGQLAAPRGVELPREARRLGLGTPRRSAPLRARPSRDQDLHARIVGEVRVGSDVEERRLIAMARLRLARSRRGTPKIEPVSRAVRRAPRRARAPPGHPEQPRAC